MLTWMEQVNNFLKKTSLDRNGRRFIFNYVILEIIKILYFENMQCNKSNKILHDISFLHRYLLAILHSVQDLSNDHEYLFFHGSNAL